MNSNAEVTWIALECQMRQEGSDEVCGTLNMVSADGRASLSHKFPGDRNAWNMGEGNERVVLVSVPLYSGPPKGLAVTASLIEHDSDSGDIAKYKEHAAKAVGKAANAAAMAATYGASVVAESVINDLARALVNIGSDLLGADDDSYNPQTLRFSEGDLVGPPFPIQTRSRPDDHKTISYTHKLEVTGTDQGGDRGAYAFYFDVRRVGSAVNGSTIAEAFKLGGPPVAANPGDHFVQTMGNRILVITNDGQVFGHDVNGSTIAEAFKLGGPPVAANPGDHFVQTMGNRILVITNDGQVFGHDVNGSTIAEAFKLGGPPVAANPGDHFVQTMGNRILVITNDGQVFGHDVNGSTIAEAFKLGGPPVAANPGDHFVQTMGNRILVITNDGQVFGHDVNGSTIAEAFKLGGPPVAANPGDHFVQTMGNRILVITNDGQVFGHDAQSFEFVGQAAPSG